MGEEHSLVFSFSSREEIEHRFMVGILFMLRDLFGIYEARFEAEAPCLVNGKLELGVVLRLFTPLTAQDAVDIWNHIRAFDSTLGLHCAWTQWGSYKGCILKLMEHVNE